jgi:hypothetical protein
VSGVSPLSPGRWPSNDVFYKYRGEHLPEEGEIIKVVRFARGHFIRARVTRVDARSDPQIEATQID